MAEVPIRFILVLDGWIHSDEMNYCTNKCSRMNESIVATKTTNVKDRNTAG